MSFLKKTWNDLCAWAEERGGWRCAIWHLLMLVPDKVSAVLARYPSATNVGLLVWNAFGTSWATGIRVPVDLSQYGAPIHFTINARVWMTNLQYHVHLSTQALAVITLAINGLVAYGHWRETHPRPIIKLKPGDTLNLKDAAISATSATITAGKK